MERAHVLVRLGDGDSPGAGLAYSVDTKAGICRTSATTVRLEHSEMSPGVASITFEQAYDAAEHSNGHVFDQSLAEGVASVVEGRAVTFVAAGAPGAGKSFACHGDAPRKLPGFVTLAIRHVFRQLETREEGTQLKVFLNCFKVNGTDVVDLLDTANNPSVIPRDQWNGADACLIDRGIRVRSSVEAVDLYSQARRNCERQDFIVALHVEIQDDGCRVRRGRFVCIDLHGNSIIEPTLSVSSQASGETNKAPYFADTHFPVNKALSEFFGGFLGNVNTTYIFVAIRRAAQYQQQAIQSLLFACKAKDIRSVCTISYLSAFTADKSPACDRKRDDDDQTDMIPTPIDDHDENRSQLDSPGTPRSPISTGACNQLDDTPNAIKSFAHSPQSISPLSKHQKQPQTPVLLSSAQKRSAVSRRLRKAYEIAKATEIHIPPSTVAPAAASGSDFVPSSPVLSRTNVLHSAADNVLKQVPSSQLAGMSLLEKLELIRLKHDDIERALAHEVAIKEKCVDRISKLTQTVSLQVIEHENQMQSVMTAKLAAEQKLRDTDAKFRSVADEIEQLQQQVNAMKSGTAAAAILAMTMPSGGDATSEVDSSSTHPVAVACTCKSDERAILHNFSSKLELAMEEAKSVVGFKDSVICDLETRLKDAEQRNAANSALFEREKLRFESEKNELRRQLAESGRQERLGIQQEKAELMVKVAQLTLDLETQRKAWADREQELEELVAKVADSEQSYADLGCLREQLAQMNVQLEDVRKKYVTLEAAHGASQRVQEGLEQQVQGLVRKLTKRKAKFERAKALLADRKQQALLAKRRADEFADQLEGAVRLKKGAQHAVEQLQVQLAAEVARVKNLDETVQHLNESVLALEKQRDSQEAQITQFAGERDVYAARAQDLEASKTEQTEALERRLNDLEQASARRMIEREAQLQAEYEARTRSLMERHSAELLAAHQHMQLEENGSVDNQRSGMMRQLSTTRTASLSSTSSRSSSADSATEHRGQDNIEDLDALINEKERRYAHATQSPRTKRSHDEDMRSSKYKRALSRKQHEIDELQQRTHQLLQALAIANKEETIAKTKVAKVELAHQQTAGQHDQLLEELNRVKQENWNLSLALQVSERR